MEDLKLGKYKHYKGNLYEVIAIARHSETLEKMVVYKALYVHEKFGKDSIWVRPSSMFLEEVNVNGKKFQDSSLLDKNYEIIGSLGRAVTGVMGLSVSNNSSMTFEPTT